MDRYKGYGIENLVLCAAVANTWLGEEGLFYDQRDKFNEELGQFIEE